MNALAKTKLLKSLSFNKKNNESDVYFIMYCTQAVLIFENNKNERGCQFQ